MATKMKKAVDVEALRKQFNEEAAYQYAPEGSVPDGELTIHTKNAIQLVAKLQAAGAKPLPDEEDTIRQIARKRWGPDCRTEPCSGDLSYPPLDDEDDDED